MNTKYLARPTRAQDALFLHYVGCLEIGKRIIHEGWIVLNLGHSKEADALYKADIRMILSVFEENV